MSVQSLNYPSLSHHLRNRLLIEHHPCGSICVLPNLLELAFPKIEFSLTTARSPNSLTYDERIVEHVSFPMHD